MSDATEQILESVGSLPDDQLQAFTEQVLRLNALRRSPSLSMSETQLLKDINQPLPPDQVARYQELVRKRDGEALRSDEHDELCGLSDWLEERNAERLGHIADLARSQGVALAEMMERLGLTYLVTLP